MATKTTRVICNSEDIPVPLIFTPLALEDLTDEPVFSLTRDGRAEIDLEQRITLTADLERCLERFTRARIAREKARGDALEAALTTEEQAALKLAWALENAVNRGA